MGNVLKVVLLKLLNAPCRGFESVVVYILHHTTVVKAKILPLTRDSSAHLVLCLFLFADSSSREIIVSRDQSTSNPLMCSFFLNSFTDIVLAPSLSMITCLLIIATMRLVQFCK